MKFKSITPKISFLILLILQSCGPKGDGCEEHEPVNTYYKISDDDKSKILLSGTDTLVYISNDGDTAVLYGKGRKNFDEKVAQKWDPDPGCQTYDFNYFENIELTYIGANQDLNYIFIDFNASIYSPQQTDADITIGGTSFITYLRALNYQPFYEDTVTINSQLYYGIKIIDIETPALNYIYNSNYGLLQITTSSRIWKKKL